jgi:hypothetical protein
MWTVDVRKIVVIACEAKQSLARIALNAGDGFKRLPRRALPSSQ